MGSNREFDIVLLGPTGYSGKLCVQHIVQNFPTNLKWALAGHSLQKIEGVAQEAKQLNPDRTEPALLAVQLTQAELNPLALRTKLIINCVGPYQLYSSPVVEACARNGTHYVDITGETPWIKQMVEKYHETAKSNGAIIIPSVGMESAPADMLTWAVVKEVREKFSCHTRHVACAIDEIKSSGASGGTLASILAAFESFSLKDLSSSMKPFALAASPPPPPKDLPSEPIMDRVLGVRSVRDMGILVNSPSSFADITIVHRSSTLMPEFYGPRFYFRQFLRVRNTFIGIVFHYGLMIGMALLALAPVRWLLKKLIFAPGQGPRMEDSRNDRVQYRAIATPDQTPETGKRVLGVLRYEGTMYRMTEHEDKVRKVSRGGLVTTATLGQEYLCRLEKAGCHVETQVLEF
ncbi:hypothetical protein ARAM_003521 [Aspergillus rambellii]|uniref:Saccharopine dehydrogenase NADP binding domain-containing protein n=1 Tax=Aspergillus rambellii TaxID=308745 RepID=A0A0F8URM1_9EURO|nr:hypothetical protein ARAM_003521 [Aspergillus rambellii]